MQIGQFQFKPSLAVSLISLVVFLILMSLGTWQMNRAQVKLLTQQELTSSLEQVELEILKPLNQGEVQRFRHVRVKGRFDTEHQYLLDNRIEKGQPGFLIITPFIYSADNAVILVNRGWLPLGETRKDLPKASVTGETRLIKGILANIPGKLPSFGISATIPDGKWPKVIRDVEIEKISQDLGYTVPPYLLQLEQENRAAYTQNWQPVASGPEKNQSYAIQWFAMALVVFILYVGLNSRRLEE